MPDPPDSALADLSDDFLGADEMMRREFRAKTNQFTMKVIHK
jgi:hypothetical protein